MNGKRAIRSMCYCAVVGLALAPGSAVNGQYDSDFEALNASAAGVILTGQDSFYLPSGTTSIDYLAYTYTGNTLGIVPNPEGGAQFIAGVGPGSPTFARAQRDITWATTGQWVIKYDVACIYLGAPPSANNIGSFTIRLGAGGTTGCLNHLFSWVDLSTPTSWRAFYMAFDAGGTQFLQPGTAPGPEWDNLLLNHWYRFETLVDFDLNMVLEVKITDLATGQTTTAQPVNWYLSGGTGTPGDRTGFRFFAGGGVPDNGVAWDNAYIGPAAACPEDINGDGVVDVLDLLLLLAAWGPCSGCPEDINGDGVVDVLDLLLLLAAWGPC